MSSPIMNLTPQQNFPTENVQSATEAFYNSAAFMANQLMALSISISQNQKAFEGSQQEFKNATNGQS